MEMNSFPTNICLVDNSLGRNVRDDDYGLADERREL